MDYFIANESKIFTGFSVAFSPSEISVIYEKIKTTIAKLLGNIINQTGEILIDKKIIDKPHNT